jgi:hypothetical protein
MCCGFFYNAADKSLEIAPALQARPFRGFWSTASGWGVFELQAPPRPGARPALRIEAAAGRLAFSTLNLEGHSVPLPSPAEVVPGRPWRI